MLLPILPPDGYRCVLIEDLRLQLFIGVNPEEKVAHHHMYADQHLLARDELADHVSYADVVAKLRERGQSARHVNLVETLAEETAELALAEPRVESVIVAVRKPNIVAEAKGVGVVIHRRRPRGV